MSDIIDENPEYSEKIEKRIKEIYETEIIKNLDLDGVCKGFEKVNSMDELKENEIFKNLFEYVWLEVDPLNKEFDDDFIEKYVRDVFLLTKWYDYLDKEDKTNCDLYLNNVFQLLIDLYNYTGNNIHYGLDSQAITEVIEMRIIKSGLKPHIIKLIMKSFMNFCDFLEKNNIEHDINLLDEEEIKDLQRVSKEFEEGAWETNGEDYIGWRERNINYYF